MPREEQVDSHTGAVLDLDEYGNPVKDRYPDGRYDRIGAGAKHYQDTGPYIRFEPGMGLNVHIGFRKRRAKHPGGTINHGPYEYFDDDKLVMGSDGFEQLGHLIDHYRSRKRAAEARDRALVPNEE